jgi:hypothetical protein
MYPFGDFSLQLPTTTPNYIPTEMRLQILTCIAISVVSAMVSAAPVVSILLSALFLSI